MGLLLRHLLPVVSEPAPPHPPGSDYVSYRQLERVQDPWSTFPSPLARTPPPLVTSGFHCHTLSNKELSAFQVCSRRTRDKFYSSSAPHLAPNQTPLPSSMRQLSKHLSTSRGMLPLTNTVVIYHLHALRLPYCLTPHSYTVSEVRFHSNL